MKNNLLAILMLISTISVQSQITLEHVYPATIGTVHFSGAGYKYYTFSTSVPNSGVINIYNLNHSLYQTINTPASIPHTQGHLSPITISSLSDSLFNTSTSNIEYIVSWTDSISYLYHTRIYDNGGNTLFSLDSLICYPIFTTAGYKMRCTDYSATNTNNPIYGLPGALPCDECLGHILITGIEPVSNNANNYRLNAYPNPTSNSTTIDYNLPDGVNQGEIVFFNLQGIEIKRFKVDKTFTSLFISTNDIIAGTYFYQLQINGDASSSKKIVVVK